MQRQIFLLSKLTAAIENVINTHCSKVVWVKAEIVRLNYYKHTGHCFPELVEKRDGKVVAEIRGNIWKAQFDQINAKFRAVLGQDLNDDMMVVLQATVSYHPLYGLALNIFDIDPEYTLGELARQKKDTIQRLQQENIYALNREKTLALLPKTIAIISVSTSKGYLDFINVIENNPWDYKFHFKLFPAVLQGEKAVPTIIAQLRKIKENRQHFDAVAILRGGGGEIGLSCYDSYDLARAIAMFPLPVLTGIGHSTNETVSELVSYQSFITPTKIAEFLLGEFNQFARTLEDSAQKLYTQSGWMIERNRNSLKEASARMISHSRRLCEKNQYELKRTAGKLEHSAIIRLKNEKHLLEQVKDKIRYLSPETILKRGFSITRINGRVVKDTKGISINDKVETRLAYGTFTSKIDKEPNLNPE